MTVGSIDTSGFGGNSDVFFAAVAAARMPMMVADARLPDHPTIVVNRAFCALTGYAVPDILGRNCRFLQGHGTDRSSVARVREALAARTEITVELLNYRRDGTPFWNALYISPVFAPDGTLIYFFASQLDVTRRHDAERALMHAQRLEGLGSLAGGVAHEFNNLLTVIYSNLEPLIGAARDPRTSARLQRVQEAAERAASLTRSMLTFARRQLLDTQSIELGGFFADCDKALRSAAGERNNLQIEQHAQPVWVRADPKELRTAVLNILFNARDALGGEGGEIVIRLRTRKRPSDRPQDVVVELHDDGSGMEPSVVARAVDPFFTTKPPGRGAGLGLSMVYGFMRQSGGRLEIESTRGQGTSIRLVFPAPRLEEDFSTAQRGRGRRILLVEDDIEMGEQAASILSTLGYQVEIAAGPADALERIGSAPGIDLLIVDKAATEAGGRSLADRAREVRPTLRTLLTTSRPTDDSSLVVKPYIVSALAECAAEALA